MERIFLTLMGVACCCMLTVTHASAAVMGNGYETRATSAAGETIFSKAVAKGSHSKFLSAIEDAGLAYMLDAQGPYTVLLPTDSAIDRLTSEQWETLTDPQNRDRLRAVLEYHILPGSIRASEFDNLNQVDTLYGQPLRMSWNGANRQFGNNTLITGRDIEADNGFFHSVDSILLPPTGFEVISYADDYSIFGEALEASGIDSSLDVDEYYTVFVPSDSAFASVPEDELEYLMLPENRAELRSVLNHYVLPGNWTASQLINRASAETVSGYDLALSSEDDNLMVNNARVIESISVYNGTIHVIDEVFTPDTAVAGSFMQRGPGNERYNYYDSNDSGEKCYFEGETKDSSYDREHNDRWQSKGDWHSKGNWNSDCGCNDGCGKQNKCDDGCGKRSKCGGGCNDRCGNWSSNRSWNSSSAPDWWLGWSN